jgi:hypothetical protein
MCSCIIHGNWCGIDSCGLVSHGLPLPLLFISRGRDFKEGNRDSYNTIPISTLSLLVYFTCILINIIIYALGSTHGPLQSSIWWAES